MVTSPKHNPCRINNADGYIWGGFSQQGLNAAMAGKFEKEIDEQLDLMEEKNVIEKAGLQFMRISRRLRNGGTR